MVEAAALAAVSAAFVVALFALWRLSRRGPDIQGCSPDHDHGNLEARPLVRAPEAASTGSTAAGPASPPSEPSGAALSDEAVPDPGVEPSGLSAASADLLVGLERLRVEREWFEAAGPGVPLPVPWNGTLTSLVAVELAVIREVIGTPGSLISLETSASGPAGMPLVVTARLASELLRALARAGEEMTVTVGSSAITVEQPGPWAGLDFGALAGLARSAGADLIVQADGEATMVRLSYPDARNSGAPASSRESGAWPPHGPEGEE